MAVIYGGQSCIEPGDFARQCAEVTPPISTAPWLGRANRFMSPLGLRAGRGYLLMSRGSLDLLDSSWRPFDSQSAQRGQQPNGQFSSLIAVKKDGGNLVNLQIPANQNDLRDGTLRPSDSAAAGGGWQLSYPLQFISSPNTGAPWTQMTIPRVRIVGTPIALAPGVRGDQRTTFLVEVADCRVDSIGWANRRYNWRIFPDAPYDTLSTRTTTIAWDWETLLTDLWDAVGNLGAFPGLPRSIAGVPEQIDATATRAAAVLEDLLLLNNMGVYYDTINDLFTIVDFAQSGTSADLLAAYDQWRLWDQEPLGDALPAIPAYARVCFPVWTPGGAPIPQDTYFAVDVAGAGGLDGTYVLIQDYQAARTDALGLVLNDGDLVDRAADVAQAWFNKETLKIFTPLYRTYAGFQFGPTGQQAQSAATYAILWDTICWSDYGGDGAAGPSTTIISTGRLGLAPILTGITPSLVGQRLSGHPDQNYLYGRDGYTVQRDGGIPRGEAREYMQGPLFSTEGAANQTLGVGMSDMLVHAGPLRQWDDAVDAQSVDGQGKRLWAFAPQSQLMMFVIITNATSQVKTWTVTVDDAGTTYAATINAVTISLAGTGGGVNATATAWAAALNAAVGDFAKVTWTVVGATISWAFDAGQQMTPGTLFNLSITTVGGTGAVSRVISKLYESQETVLEPDPAGAVGLIDKCWYTEPNSVAPSLNSIHLCYLDGTTSGNSKVYIDTVNSGTPPGVSASIIIQVTDSTPQITSITIASDDTDTTYAVTIAGVTVSVPGNGGGVNATAADLGAALTASVDPGFASATWSVVGATITWTPIPGPPFVSASVSGGPGTVTTVNSSIYPAVEITFDGDGLPTEVDDCYYRAANGNSPLPDSYHEVILSTSLVRGLKVYEDAMQPLVLFVKITGTDSSTTSTGSIATGSQTVTPVSMTNIIIGRVLIIDAGLPSEESVTVTAITGSTFDATFFNTHLAGATIYAPGDTNGRYPAIERLYNPVARTVADGDVCWYKDQGGSPPVVNSYHLSLQIDVVDGVKVYQDSVIGMLVEGTDNSGTTGPFATTRLEIVPSVASAPDAVGHTKIVIDDASATQSGIVNLSAQTLGDDDKTVQQSFYVNSKLNDSYGLVVGNHTTVFPIPGSTFADQGYLYNLGYGRFYNGGGLADSYNYSGLITDRVKFFVPLGSATNYSMRGNGSIQLIAEPALSIYSLNGSADNGYTSESSTSINFWTRDITPIGGSCAVTLAQAPYDYEDGSIYGVGLLQFIQGAVTSVGALNGPPQISLGVDSTALFTGTGRAASTASVNIGLYTCLLGAQSAANIPLDTPGISDYPVYAVQSITGTNYGIYAGPGLATSAGGIVIDMTEDLDGGM